MRNDYFNEKVIHSKTKTIAVSFRSIAIASYRTIKQHNNWSRLMDPTVDILEAYLHLGVLVVVLRVGLLVLFYCCVWVEIFMTANSMQNNKKTTPSNHNKRASGITTELVKNKYIKFPEIISIYSLLCIVSLIKIHSNNTHTSSTIVGLCIIGLPSVSSKNTTGSTLSCYFGGMEWYISITAIVSTPFRKGVKKNVSPVSREALNSLRGKSFS